MIGDPRGRHRPRGSVWIPAVLSTLALGVGWEPVSASAATSHSSKQTLVDFDCLSKGGAKPAQILLACGDGNAIAEHLSWIDWDSTGATATGVLTQNDCVPNCASGTFHNYPARFVLSELVLTDGRDYFTRVTIRFKSNGPGDRRTESVKDCFDSPPAAYIPRCPSNLQSAG